jgi:hypothetical protein
MSAFGSLHRMAMATQEEIAQCKGVGPKKAHELYQWLHRSFHGGSEEVGEKGGQPEITVHFSQSTKEIEPTSMEEEQGKEKKEEKDDGSLQEIEL